MEISVKGKNLDVGDALRGHAESQLDVAVSKYFNHAIDATVMFSRQGHGMRADISVHPGPRGLVVQSGSESEDPYVAFDGALERVAKQLRRYKRRLNDHHQKARDGEDMLLAQQYVIQAEHHEDEAAVDSPPVIVAPPHSVTSVILPSLIASPQTSPPVSSPPSAISGSVLVPVRVTLSRIVGSTGGGTGELLSDSLRTSANAAEFAAIK